MLPELTKIYLWYFLYYYSTYQEILQNKQVLKRYTNSNICTKYLRHQTPIILQKTMKIKTCSKTPLSYPLQRRFLPDTDQIGHRCNQPLHPPQADPAEYVASKTSPTQVHVLCTIRWLWRCTFQNSQVLYEVSPPTWAARPRSPLGCPQCRPWLEQHLLDLSALQALIASSPETLTSPLVVGGLSPSPGQNPLWSTWAFRSHLRFGT